MLRLRKLSTVLSSNDKALLSEHLKGKGIRQPKGWTLIHSEACSGDELKFNTKPLLTKLSKEHGYDFKGAVNIVSDPNANSSLDKGQFRVRYRYGIAANHAGEPLIKDNTREFCETLVRAKKIYRREDINIMSFRGANPIAKRNYSIFNLKGHWNCRHAWIREVFVIERDPSETENNPTVEKTTLMSNIEKAVAAFKKEMGDTELTKEMLVTLNEDLLKEQKFVDVKVDDKILRIDGELAEGTSVAWVGDDGEMMDVEDGEITLVDEKKVLTITDGKISAIVDVEEEVEEEEATPEALSKEGVEAIIEEKLSAFTESLEAKFSKLGEDLDEKLSNVPAFKKKKVSNSFKATPATEEKDAPKRRPSVNSSFKRPEVKED